MLRDLDEISDGKVYGSSDMVRAACDDCAGCHACCEGMGTSIVLDPFDMWQLTAVTGMGFAELMEEAVELNVADGMILPNLKMVGGTERCYFLDAAGRCSIHKMRPGLCRLFPLGRIYEEDEVVYFLQPEACRKKNRTKVKVSKWIGVLGQQYEQFLLAWRKLRRRTEEMLRDADEQTARTLNLFLLNLFFVTDYDGGQDFYPQFAERMQKAEAVLGQR